VLDEGTHVSRGQVVAQIDPAQAQAAVRRGRAALAEAEAALEEAEDAHRRWQPLVKEAIISALEFEQVRARRDQALAGRQQAIEALREAEQMVEQTRLRAPFAGVVEERLVRGGEQVTPGEPLVRLVGAGPRIVTAGLPERFAADIQPGARAVVGLQAYGLDEIVAAVTFVGAAVDPQSRTFPVRIEIDDPDARVKVDMIARVRVVRRTLAEALVVPRDAILRDEREETVLVVEERDGDRGTLARRVIAAGPAALEGVVIEAGLQPGDEVVVVGQQERHAGEDVRVVRQHDHMEAYRAAAGTGRDP
jgi:membrane fusion protein, multidrug efflux system